MGYLVVRFIEVIIRVHAAISVICVIGVTL